MSLLYNLMRDRQNRFEGQNLADNYQNINQGIEQDNASDMYRQDNKEIMKGQAEGPLPTFDQYKEGSSEPIEMSSADRYKAQIDAFMRSGNPKLMEMGEKMFLKAHEKSLTTSNNTTAHQLAMNMQLVPGTPEYLSFIKDYALKTSNTTIDMGNERVSTDEANKLRYPGGGKVRPGTPWDKAYENGVVSISAAEATGDAKSVTAVTIAKEIDSMLFGPDGIYNDLEFDSFYNKAKSSLKANAEHYLKDDPRYNSYNKYAEGTLASLVKSLGESGSLATEDIERAKSLIPKIQGLSIDTPEIAREKISKLMRLIASGKRNGSITKAMLDQLEVPAVTSLKKEDSSMDDLLGEGEEYWVPDAGGAK